MRDFDSYSGDNGYGSNYSSNYQHGESENNYNFPGSSGENRSNHSGGHNGLIKFISILLTFIFIFVCRFAGGYIAKSFIKGNETKKINSYIKEIDAYIEKTKDYKQGICTNEEYTSEYFGIRFSANDEWQMLSEKDLVPYTEQLRDSSISSALESIKANEIDQRLKDKLIESVRVKTEMGAIYASDETVVGELAISSLQFYGLHMLSEDGLDDFFQSAKNSILASTGNKVYDGERTLAGKTYKSLKVNTTIDGMELSVEELFQFKDGVIYMIICKALPNYADEMMRSFEEHISAY